MAFCPECDAEIVAGPFDYEEGEIIECAECGAELEVTSASPLEVEVIEPDLDDDDFDVDDMDDYDDQEWD